MAFVEKGAQLTFLKPHIGFVIFLRKQRDGNPTAEFPAETAGAGHLHCNKIFT